MPYPVVRPAWRTTGVSVTKMVRLRAIFVYHRGFVYHWQPWSRRTLQRLLRGRCRPPASPSASGPRGRAGASLRLPAPAYGMDGAAPSSFHFAMRLLFVALASLLVLIQYPLWLGQGSWSRVWQLSESLALQREVNTGKRLRNEGLEAEVEDLRSGTSAVEERARYGLGMVKPDEIFVQINPSPDSPATGH